MPTRLSARPTTPLLAPEAGLVETLRWAVAHAVLAPSLLNSQPWLFRALVDEPARAARLELYLDRRRGLAHLDPDGREAVLACGAALLNLRLTLRAAGVGSTLRLLPDVATPELLAVLAVHGRAQELDEERALREAIPLRATYRDPFEQTGVSAPVLDSLLAAAAYEGALLAVLDETETAALHRLAALARRRTSESAGHAADLASWARPGLGSTDDGLPGRVHGLGLVDSLAEPRRLRRGTSTVAARESAQELTAGRLVVLGAPGDDRAALLRAGAGLQRMLLTATAHGIAARFVDDVMRFSDTRVAVARAVGLDHPEVALHLGSGHAVPVTGRRPVDDVLTVLDLKEASP